MKHVLILALILLFQLPMMTKAGTPNSKALAKSNKSHSQLGTSFRFNPNSLKGKYQGSPSTSAIVENDKFLDDLLAPRMNFNDRTAEDQQRN